MGLLQASIAALPALYRAAAAMQLCLFCIMLVLHSVLPLLQTKDCRPGACACPQCCFVLSRVFCPGTLCEFDVLTAVYVRAAVCVSGCTLCQGFDVIFDALQELANPGWMRRGRCICR